MSERDEIIKELRYRLRNTFAEGDPIGQILIGLGADFLLKDKYEMALLGDTKTPEEIDAIITDLEAACVRNVNQSHKQIIPLIKEAYAEKPDIFIKGVSGNDEQKKQFPDLIKLWETLNEPQKKYVNDKFWEGIYK